MKTVLGLLLVVCFGFISGCSSDSTSSSGVDAKTELKGIWSVSATTPGGSLGASDVDFSGTTVNVVGTAYTLSFSGDKATAKSDIGGVPYNLSITLTSKTSFDGTVSTTVASNSITVATLKGTKK